MRCIASVHQRLGCPWNRILLPNPAKLKPFDEEVEGLVDHSNLQTTARIVEVWGRKKVHGLQRSQSVRMRYFPLIQPGRAQIEFGSECLFQHALGGMP